MLGTEALKDLMGHIMEFRLCPEVAAGRGARAPKAPSGKQCDQVFIQACSLAAV